MSSRTGSRPILRVDGLGKRYRRGRRAQHGGTFAETLGEMVSSALGGRAPWRRETSESFWALRDVSFEVHPGEVIGIIGRNGAGKSTLLKLLSRVTEPTTGTVELFGRVGSLLEVGTGFHPELTGRENIFLNGAILGMRRAEIRRKFDEIVEFAEIGRFLDTAVKHYSSGMYVRLAFAVAAHLQPEILIVDEVLAVGDVEFQKKCIGKIENVSSGGKTVIMVTHSMSIVQALCPKAILLENGIITKVGPARSVVSHYLKSLKVEHAERVVTDADHGAHLGRLRLRRVKLVNSCADSFTVYWKQPIQLLIEVEAKEPTANVSLGAGIRTVDGVKILTVHHDDNGTHPLLKFQPGRYEVELTLPNDLRPGVYQLHVGADVEHIRQRLLFAIDLLNFEVLDHTETGVVPLASNEGLVNGTSTWGKLIRNSEHGAALQT